MGFKNILLGVVLMVMSVGICLVGATMWIYAPVYGGGGNTLITLVLVIFGIALGIYGKNMTRG